MAGKNKTVDTENSGSLPPLSASDFRAYNRLSEQMEGFVSCGLAHARRAITDTSLAQSLPVDLEPALGCL